MLLGRHSDRDSHSEPCFGGKGVRECQIRIVQRPPRACKEIIRRTRGIWTFDQRTTSEVSRQWENGASIGAAE